MPEIKLDHVTVAYSLNRKNEFLALEDYSDCFADGKFHSLIGESGAGKSTLLRVISGLASYEGNVLFDGKNMDDVPPQKRNVAYVTQEIKLFPGLTIFDNIAFPLVEKKEKREEIIPQVYKISENLGIRECLSRKPKQISLGQQQRASLARALIKNPSLLLLDEPFSSQDKVGREDYLKRLNSLSQEKKMTVLYVTHDFKEALAFGDDIHVVSEGKLLLAGTKEEILVSSEPLLVEMKKELQK